MRAAVTITIRVVPGAGRDRVGGAHGEPPALVVAVRARAVDGAATRAALRELAEALAVRPRQVTLRAGATSRRKLVAVSDPPDDLADRVAALLARGRS